MARKEHKYQMMFADGKTVNSWATSKKEMMGMWSFLRHTHGKIEYLERIN